METVWQRVVRGNYQPKEHGDQLDEYRSVFTSMAPHAEKFDITNVAEFFYSGNSREYWDLQTDFPNLVPPFMEMWMEFSAPSCSNNNGTLNEWPGAKRTAVLLETAREEDKSGWTISILPFYWLSGEGVWQGASFAMMLLDENGVLKHFVTDEATPTMAGVMFPFAFALSLMHCRNVKTQDAPDSRAPSEKRRDARRGIPEVKFKTLAIEPMKRVLREEGKSETTGLRKALHICRGHFSHYTEEKPLFGKYSGQFWVPAHVRGSAESGVVIKDYNVKAPTAA